MRVVVANLTGGGLSGGYRKYLQRLMPLLASDPRIDRLSIFVPAASGVRLEPRLDVRVYESTDAGVRVLVSDVHALAPDVVFVPTARFVDFGRPLVTMVRNMEPLTVPFGGNSVKEGIRNLGRAGQAKRASKSATRVIAVSRFVRDFLVSRWRIPAERVGIVYHGVDQVPGGGTVNPRVLFTAGSIRPARGVEDAITALAELPRDVQLRIAGAVDPGAERYAKQLREIAHSVGVADRVTWTGPLTEIQMNAELKACGAFIMTSRAEACPNTALEAMSAGSLIVSVDHEPMPEFFGDAALYYRAGDAESLAARVAHVLQGGVDRAVMTARTGERARQFSWDTTCDLTIRELELARS